MNKETLEEIKRLQEIDDKESHEKIIELVDKETKVLPNKKEEKQYTFIKNKSEIRLLEIQLETTPETDQKNQIHLTGKIIKLYKKQTSLAIDKKDQMSARYKVIELLEKQKELTKGYKNSNTDLKLKDKVALTIKDIAKTIEIFLNKKDIITKAKNVLKETAIGSVEAMGFIVIIGLIAPLVGGMPFSLSIIAKSLPVIGYIGLSSIIRNCLTKTEFQQYQYYQSEEYKKYLEDFKKENQALLEELNNVLQEKQSLEKPEEQLEINNELIKITDEIISKIKDDGLRRTYEIMAFGFLRENKDICQKVIDEYLDEKNDNKEKYKEYQKKLSKINIELFKRGNSLKDALVYAGKQAGLSLAVMIIAKSLITVMAPNSAYALRNLNSLVIPLILAITNGIVSIPTYTNKLKYQETKEEKEIEPKDKKAFEKLFGQLKLQPSL